MKLTPREPTAQMLWSGATALLDESENDLDATAKEIAAAWRAMHDAAPSGWQPIETAPRDGTALLVMRDIWPGTDSGRAESCNGHNTYVAAWWSFEGSDGTGRWVCYMDAVFDPTCPIQPTHWMPLPAPPSEQTQAAPSVPSVEQELLEALETLSIFLPSDHPEPADNDRIQPGFVYIRWGDLRKARAAIARAKGE